MAPVESVLDVCSRYFNYSFGEDNISRCNNCIKIIVHTKVLTMELESLQLLIKLSQAELKYNVDERRIADIMKDESASEWTEVFKKNHSIKQQKQTSRYVNNSVKHSILTFQDIIRYTVPVGNRCIFVTHHELQENNVGISHLTSEQHNLYEVKSCM
jgi:seryl-tRNA synthetase